MNYVHSKVLCAGLEASRGPKPDLQEYRSFGALNTWYWNERECERHSTRVQAKLSKRQRFTRNCHFRLEKPQPPKHLDWGHHSRGTENLAKSVFIQYSHNICREALEAEFIYSWTGCQIPASSLIRAGWCQEERTSGHQNLVSVFIHLKPNIPRDRQLPPWWLNAKGWLSTLCCLEAAVHTIDWSWKKMPVKWWWWWIDDDDWETIVIAWPSLTKSSQVSTTKKPGPYHQIKASVAEFIIIIISLTSIFFQDKSRVWTAASQQH